MLSELPATRPRMSAREEERLAREQLANLHALGREAGAGAPIWSRVIADELRRHDDARAQYLTNEARMEDWDRFCGSGLVIAIAIGQVLGLERRVRSLTGDPRLAQARANFDAAVPNAEPLRDLVAHLADYAVGSGLRQTTGANARHGAPIAERNVKPLIYWTNTGDSYLVVAGQQLILHRAATAAIALADAIEKARARKVNRAVKRLNDASRRANELDLP